MKAFSTQFILALALALLYMLIVNGLSLVFPDLGWHILTLAYILILLCQILFYYLTAKQKLGLAVLNFTMNFIFWIAELVILEHFFGETDFYQSRWSAYPLSGLSGILWVLNKVMLDYIFGFMNKGIVKSRIELYLER